MSNKIDAIKPLLISDSMTIVERICASLSLNETQRRIFSRVLAVTLTWNETEGEDSDFTNMMYDIYKLEGKIDDKTSDDNPA